MLSILLWIVFGAVIGFVADFIDKSVELSWLERTAVGIIGAVVGGSIAQLITTGTIGLAASASFDILSIVIAVLGALVALFVWKRIRGSGSRSVV
jgi:uncharacterized membrane protein YeaQ/YmgE (transglycosylase-associated protein family)